MTGQEILPLLEEEQEEETTLKRRRLRKSHRMSHYHSRRARDRSQSEKGSCHLRRARELPWRVEAPRQLWDPNEEDNDSHVKRKKRRRQKSRKYQTGEYLTEREEEEHVSCYSHRRRKSKAGTGTGRGEGSLAQLAILQDLLQASLLFQNCSQSSGIEPDHQLQVLWAKCCMYCCSGTIPSTVLPLQWATCPLQDNYCK